MGAFVLVVTLLVYVGLSRRLLGAREQIARRTFQKHTRITHAAEPQDALMHLFASLLLAVKPTAVWNCNLSFIRRAYLRQISMRDTLCHHLYSHNKADMKLPLRHEAISMFVPDGSAETVSPFSPECDPPDIPHFDPPDCDTDEIEDDDPFGISAAIDEQIWDAACQSDCYTPPNDLWGENKTTLEQQVASMSDEFVVPERLRNTTVELLNTVNGWHYAMMNDYPRNAFYRDALRRVINPESVVLEIGAGSGLLSVIAASLGARCVIAIEANRELSAIAREIVRRNGQENRVHIINNLSTSIEPEELAAFGKPTVLLSEIFGTTLLGESALHYVSDARDRLAPNATIVPCHGSQFATLVESEALASLTSVQQWDGIDLSYFNTLQNTATLYDTKSLLCRFSSYKYRELSPKTAVLQVDFSQDEVGMWKEERRHRIRATSSGIVHAVLVSWEVHNRNHADALDASGGSNERLTMSTHPCDTLNNMPRDMHWGQGLQLIEDLSGVPNGGMPVPFRVREGEWLTLVTRYSINGQTMQFQLERDAPPTT